MYRVPAEFIRQKTVIFGPITLAHAVGAFGGFFLGQALGDNPWVVLACVALGLTLTTLRVRGLTLYLFIPLVTAYLVRRLTGDALEPDAPAEAVAATSTHLFVMDEEGNPIIFQEEE